MKKTLKQKAYQIIKNKIMNFELRPGESIRESAVSRDLKLGRMPVREALAMLENENLLVKTAGYGYQIKKLKDSEINDYFKIRCKLESVGVQMLIERATDADISRMKKHIEKAVEIYKGDNIIKMIESDTQFHDMMYQATKSTVLYDTISCLSNQTIIMRAAAMQTQSGRDSSITDHIKIMAAIEERDLEGLQMLISEHLKFAPMHYESIRTFIFV